MTTSQLLSSQQLMSIIETQTAIAKLGLDLYAVMTLAANQAQKLTQATGAIVELVESDDMVYQAVSNNAEHLLGIRLKRHNSLSGLCIDQKITLYCLDSETDQRVDRVACRRVGLRSMAVVPLIHHDEAVGVLKIYSDQIEAFNASDLQLLSMMSELIAASMYHATKFGDQELYKMATQDSLTGLANRALFLDFLRQNIQSAQQSRNILAILMVDMDGLKQINDQHGHRFGDTALIEISQRLVRNIRKEDLVARLGGDEFVVVLPSVSEKEMAFHMMQRLIEACGQPFNYENRNLKIGASIGLALYPLDASDIQQLIELADLNMYSEKKIRKNITA